MSQTVSTYGPSFQEFVSEFGLANVFIVICEKLPQKLSRKPILGQVAAEWTNERPGENP